MGLFDKKNKQETEQVDAQNMKEQQTAEASDRKEDNGKVLEYLIEKHHVERSEASMMSVIHALQESNVWVPMTVKLSEEDVQALMNVKKSEMVTTKNGMKMQPAMLKTQDDEWYYPVFTSKEQAPEAYRKGISMVNLSFRQYAMAALNNPNIKGMVVNAFEKSFVLPKDFLMAMTNTFTEAHKLDKNAQISLIPLQNTFKERLMMEKAEQFFEKNESVKKAYAAKLNTDGSISYVLVVDAPGLNPQTFFSALHQEMEPLKMGQRMDYVMYPMFREQLETIECEPFFTRE